MMLARLPAAIAVSIVLATLAACAHVSAPATVVDVPTRGVTQRFLYVHPDAPVANIIFLPGRDGMTGVEDDGSIPTIIGRCGPFSRNRDAFAARGFAIAIVDKTSDGKVRQFTDVYEIARYMRNRDNVPIWIVGGSGSTNGALRFAAELPPDEPLGVIIYSPGSPDLAAAAKVKAPTLVIYHQADQSPWPQDIRTQMLARPHPFADPLFDALTAAPVKERIVLAGGVSMDECGGHHLLMGIDDDFVAAVAGFVGRYNAFAPARARQ